MKKRVSPRFRTTTNRSPRWQIEDYDPGLRNDRSPRKIFPAHVLVRCTQNTDTDRHKHTNTQTSFAA